MTGVVELFSQSWHAIFGVGMLYMYLYSGWNLVATLEEDFYYLLDYGRSNPPKKKKLSILSLNCWCNYISPSPLANPRIWKIIHHIQENDYDVILLQELFLLRVGPFCYAHEIRVLISELQNLGYVHFSSPLDTMPNFLDFGQNSGLLICSKYEFEFDEQEFEESHEHNSKGFSVGRFSWKDEGMLYIATTHLSHKSWSVRRRQLYEISRYLSQLPPALTILAGDFNIAPECEIKPFERSPFGSMSNQYKFLASTLKDLPVPLQNCFENNKQWAYSKLEKNKWELLIERATFGLYTASFAFKPTKETSQSVDHFFVSEGVHITDAKRVYIPGASDHLGMQVDVKLDFEIPMDDG